MMKKLLLLLILFVSLVSCQSEIYLEDGIIKCIEDVKVGFIGEVDGVSYKVIDGIMLSNMIKNNDDITHICVSKITNMSDMFGGTKFNGDISKWDVSNVTTMSNMFGGTGQIDGGTKFNGDISKWDGRTIEIAPTYYIRTFYMGVEDYAPVFKNYSPASLPFDWNDGHEGKVYEIEYIIRNWVENYETPDTPSEGKFLTKITLIE
jgi:surface protein